MKESVAPPDDGVHCVFALLAGKIIGGLMDGEVLDDLREYYGPKHRERHFTLPTILWLGIHAAAHASLRWLAGGCRASRVRE